MALLPGVRRARKPKKIEGCPWAADTGIDDPVEFQRVWLQRSLWAKEREILRALETHAQVAVKGCHASGKTFTASGAPLQHLTRYRDGKGMITAPALRQVRIFFEEISLARQSSPVSSLLPEPLKTALRVTDNRYILGATSSRGVNLQSFHGGHVLIICDEAPGIKADIWESIEGIRAGGDVRVLKLGNPTVPSGAFYDAFTKEAASHACISISAFDTPNLQREDGSGPVTIEELAGMNAERLAWTVYPQLIRRAWVLDRWKSWGPKHPAYESRVLAQFPSQDPHSCFPLAWVERAKRDATEREQEMAKRCMIQVGIDVAGPGHDETTLVARVGGMILEQLAWPDPDPRGPVLAALHRLRSGWYPYQLGKVVIDIVGIGYNFALHVADQGYDVFGFSAGKSAIDPDQFANQKAEAHFTLRDYLKEDQISGLDDAECAAQLSTIQYRENSKGKVEIESKEQRNQRGIPGSPDRAEGLIMAFMRVVPRVQEPMVLGGVDAYQISPI